MIFLLQGVTFLNQKIILEPLSALVPIRDIPKDSFLHELSASENLKFAEGENLPKEKLETELMQKNENENDSSKSEE